MACSRARSTKAAFSYHRELRTTCPSSTKSRGMLTSLLGANAIHFPYTLSLLLQYTYFERLLFTVMYCNGDESDNLAV